MATTTERRPCRVEREWVPTRAAGVHAVIEKVTGHTCEGAGQCVAESHLFAPTHEPTPWVPLEPA